MGQGRKALGRRTFLTGLVTGAGVVAALGGAPRKTATKKPEAGENQVAGQVLYRRTKEAERYYRTLYT
jgi:hypothetical protein